jgi:hypothetical protein
MRRIGGLALLALSLVVSTVATAAPVAAATTVTAADPVGDNGDDFDERGDIVEYALALDSGTLTATATMQEFVNPATSAAWQEHGSGAEFHLDTDGDGDDDFVVNLYNDAGVVKAPVDRTSNGTPACDAAPSWSGLTKTFTVTLPMTCLDAPVSVRLRVDFFFLTGETNSLDDTAWSDPVTAPATAPDAPSAVVATAGDGQASVQWTAPDDNGSAITSYSVVAQPGSIGTTVAGGVTQATLTGLTNGQNYTITVTATNGVGPGPSSQPSNTVTPLGVPSAPTNVTATVDKHLATVTWSAANPNGSAIDSYTVIASPGGAQVVVAGTKTTAKLSLPVGTFTFRVRATSGVGPSALSAASNPVTVQPTPNPRAGYWMLGADGRVYPFGNAPRYGSANMPAVAIATRLDGKGYWIVSRDGRVKAFGEAAYHGDRPPLPAGDVITSISATPTGRGYWLFSARGYVARYGDAQFYGDMRNVVLNGPVIASVATATGRGYYMVGSDGGVFTFGDAKFLGSMGGKPLNRPVVGIAPTPDGKGYWLVASDGGVFAYKAPFRGSMGSTRLNKPVNGLVAFGNGYLMVASDGGVFNFSNKTFFGSLGSTPPAAPVIGIAAFATS